MEPAGYKHLVPPGLVVMIRNLVRKTRIFGLVTQSLDTLVDRVKNDIPHTEG
jgi:hypothetical protein